MDIMAAVFCVKPGEPFKNADMMIDIMKENEADIYLFPAYCLTGATCGKLVNFKPFTDKMNEALDKLCEFSENEEKCFVTAVAGYGNIIVRNGDLIQKPSVSIGGKKVVVSQPGDDGDADVLLLPTAMAGYPCIQNDIIEFCADSSKAKRCVIAVANAGYGESSADNVYKGFSGIFKNGIICDFKSQDLPESVKAKFNTENKSGLIYARPQRGADRIPYYGKNDPKRYLKELFGLQTQALYTRLSGAKIDKIVLGVSGGSDSTLALLCAVNVLKLMDKPLSNITAVLMPCFGTGTRTYENSKVLTEELGVSVSEINISNSVKAHFSDIGHDIAEQDTVYENAQARERTQVLFDIANKLGAVVLGTGDMTENALGFCTFGGDNLGHYNINAQIPKTLVLELIKMISSDLSFIGFEAKENKKLSETLADIAQTPISPELKKGQETEKIIGKYILHDFFMFFFAKRFMSYSDIKNYALAVFEEYDEDEITACLDTFFARYKSNRFKRAAVFEGANLIGFSLPYIPSDIDYDL